MKKSALINNYVNQLENHISKYKIKNSKVSQSTIGWQIDHSLKVINSVAKTLQTSDPSLYKNSFSFLGRLFFTLGFFPRGKARAPKYVRPPETILKEDLILQVQLAKSNIEALQDLDKDAFFKHPLFGNINSKRVHRFLELHTKHHLKIIDDILSN
ncbi:hypothetical protein FBALC1_01387 [Flavobacteriales bacterium ALC-1]|nr:hypothetical protein FBALC1_01387 [Flavobacteriales bacterium ALC-1]